jgi:hypothetical protein
VLTREARLSERRGRAPGLREGAFDAHEGLARLELTALVRAAEVWCRRSVERLLQEQGCAFIDRHRELAQTRLPVALLLGTSCEGGREMVRELLALVPREEG